MTEILSPLDCIIDLVKNLQQSSHTERRASLYDNVYEKIINNVNLAKNAIIMHLLDSNPSSNKDDTHTTKIGPIKTYASVTNSINPKVVNSLIINAGEAKASKETLMETEKRVISTLKNQNANVTIKNTNCTDKGNIVFYFDKDDKITPLKPAFENEFGTSVKLKSPLLPKIKIVSVPTFFDTTNKNEVTQAIINSNDSLQQAFQNDPSLILDLVTSYKRNTTKTLVIKCSPKIRELIKFNKDKICIEHKLCPVYDSFYLTYCTRCSAYGHMTKSCTASNPTCLRCNEPHVFSSCPHINDTDAILCNACNNSKDASLKQNAKNHVTFNNSCPIHKQRMANLVAKIDFGFSPPSQPF